MVEQIQLATQSILEQAKAEVDAERAKKGKEALKVKLRQLAAAQDVVRNLEREVEDLARSVEDGSF